MMINNLRIKMQKKIIFKLNIWIMTLIMMFNLPKILISSWIKVLMRKVQTTRKNEINKQLTLKVLKMLN